MFGGERAQSEVLGTVLLLGLTVTVVGSTVALGGAALDDSQTRADLQRAEGAMTQLDSKTSLVAHGESPSQRLRMDVGRTADFRVSEDAGWMRIEVETAETEVNETVTLGAVVYERDGETVAYQGGGVWRSGGGGARMVSPPEFHYRGDTLTLPLVTVDGDGRVGDAAVVSRVQGRPTGLFPTEDVANPLFGGNVTITVESDYAAAWGRFFESRTEANVTQLSSDTVEVELRTETVHPTLSAGASAVGASRLEFGGIHTLYADSYDSTEGVYPGAANARDNSVVQTTSDFHLTAGGGGNTESIEIRGDLVAESLKIPNGQADKLTVTGETRTDDSLDSPASISGAVAEPINRIRNLDLGASRPRESLTLDGGDETVTKDTYINGSVKISDGSTLTVEEGATLHISGELDVDGSGQITVDTTNGNINILVEDAARFTDTSRLRTVGGNRVNLYVDDSIEAQSDDDSIDGPSVTTASDTRLDIYNTGPITLGDRTTVTADSDIARNLWVYSSGDTVNLGVGDNDDNDGELRFTGVFYAPQTHAKLEGKVDIKGSVTFDKFSFDYRGNGNGNSGGGGNGNGNNGGGGNGDGDTVEIEIHYDESLRGQQPFGGDSVPVVSHLHVSEHRVVVDTD